MTYLFFMKMLDDAQLKKEANANILGATVKDAVFKGGAWSNLDTGREVSYTSLRWHVFKNYDSQSMFDDETKLMAAAD